MQAGHTDIDVHRHAAEAGIRSRPVVSRHRFPEPVRDRLRGGRLIEVGQKEAELIAAEPRVERRGGVSFVLWMRDPVRRADFTSQQLGHRLDDAIAGGMAERVVMRLEGGDVCDAEGAPGTAPLSVQAQHHMLHEVAEVEKLRLDIAVGTLGEVGDQPLEVQRDVPGGGFTRTQLVTDLGAELRRSGRDGPDGFVLGLPPHAFVVKQDVIDGGQQRLFGLRWQRQSSMNPILQVGPGVGCRARVRALRLESLVFRRHRCHLLSCMNLSAPAAAASPGR